MESTILFYSEATSNHASVSGKARLALVAESPRQINNTGVEPVVVAVPVTVTIALSDLTFDVNCLRYLGSVSH